MSVDEPETLYEPLRTLPKSSVRGESEKVTKAALAPEKQDFPLAMNQKQYNPQWADKYYGVNRLCTNCSQNTYIYIRKRYLVKVAVEQARPICPICECATISAIG